MGQREKRGKSERDRERGPQSDSPTRPVPVLWHRGGVGGNQVASNTLKKMTGRIGHLLWCDGKFCLLLFRGLPFSHTYLLTYVGTSFGMEEVPRAENSRGTGSPGWS